jgi:pimeloyl-ACP methyl ester carboxylesterase
MRSTERMHAPETRSTTDQVIAGRVDIDGHPFAFERRGSGVPLLLIAGTGYPGATWHPGLLDALGARHTVVTFDHRGTGATPASSGRYSTRLFASDALALLDALGLDAAHVVGHSMGGRVAQWMALDRPDRVRSLVLAATGPGQFRTDRPVTRGVPVHAALELIEKGYERYTRDHIAATFFTPEFGRARPEVVGWLQDAFWRNRPDLENYLRHVVARQEHQTADRLSDIAVATLVVVGDRDDVVMGTGAHTEQSDYLARHIPGATRRVVEGAAHGFFWSHPERTIEILFEWMSTR